MNRRISTIVLGAYLVALALLVWRADVKYGPETAAGFVGVGLVFLVVLWRLWRGFRYVLFGGRAPVVTLGQNTQFQPPQSNRPRSSREE